jgi:cobyric acid synthase
LFNSLRLRRTMLENIGASRNKPLLPEAPSVNKDAEYDKLAALVRNSLDMDLVYNIAGLGRRQGK